MVELANRLGSWKTIGKVVRPSCICGIEQDSKAKHLPFEELSGRLRLKCDDTRVETIFLLSARRTSPFKSAGL